MREAIDIAAAAAAAAAAEYSALDQTAKVGQSEFVDLDGSTVAAVAVAAAAAVAAEIDGVPAVAVAVVDFVFVAAVVEPAVAPTAPDSADEYKSGSDEE